MNEVYLQRAEQLARARQKLLIETPQDASATALLSVHSAIALSDALILALGARRAKAEDHRSAAAFLEKTCRERRIQTAGIVHLRSLLSNKTDVSYGDQSVSQEKAARLAASAERFERWAYPLMEGPE